MRRLLVALLSGTLLVGAVGCGGDDEGGGEPAAVAVEVTPSGQGRFKLEAPESVEAGLVRLEFRNGTKDDAEAFLMRLEDGHTLEEALALISSDAPTIPDWFLAEGGVGTTKPGKSGVVELVLEEGTYYILDAASEGDDTESHAENGATATLEVSGGDDGAELPEVDASIEMNEYSFVTEGLKPGRNRFLLQNTGDELHHTVFFPIREGATSAQVREFMTSDEQGSDAPPPVDFENTQNTTVLDGGREQIDELEFAAGRYALVCFITDREGGPPHVVKGMLREVTISE